MNNTELLSRWGLDRLVESFYHRIFLKVKRRTQASLIHNLGILFGHRGDYKTALEKYEASLKIKEEIGDRAGIALTKGQIGNLFKESNRFQEAFEYLLFSLETFSEIGSPNAKIAAENIKTLRKKWGHEEFDDAWKAKFGEDVPGWVKE